MALRELKKELQSLADKNRATASAWFFKTGSGQYGAGDKFIGIRVPAQRKVAYKYLDLELSYVRELLQSPIHEHRFVALEILVAKYERGDLKTKKTMFDFYLKNRKFVNNWDLVDTSAGYILGDYLLTRNKTVLFKLARSKALWDKRIAIIATQGFIKEGQFMETLKIAELLLNDKHDLIHKAVGWMLREVGNRSPETELKFLDKYCLKMPRTMLRYAIEKFPEKKRKYYLNLR